MEWNDLQSSKTNALPTPSSFFHGNDKYIERRQHAQVKFYLQLRSSYPTLTGYHPYPFEEGEIFNAAFWPATGLQGSPPPGSAGMSGRLRGETS